MAEENSCVNCKHCDSWTEYGQHMSDCKIDTGGPDWLFREQFDDHDQAATVCKHYEERDLETPEDFNSTSVLNVSIVDDEITHKCGNQAAGEDQDETYQEYTVRWEIQITATSRERAAKEALEEMRDRGSSAQVFDVIDEHGDTEMIDLYDDQV